MSKTFKDKNSRVEEPRRRREDYPEERHKVKQVLQNIANELSYFDEDEYWEIDEELEMELELNGRPW